MVLPRLKTFVSRHFKPEHGAWVQVSQAFMGLFFMSSGSWKLYNYFITGDQYMYHHMQYWLDKGWPPWWYAWFMKNFVMFHDTTFAILVVLLQFVPGFMILMNIRARLAAFFLMFLQILVFFGVFGHTNFNEFVGLSIWMALFYVLKPANPADMNQKVWLLMKVLFLIPAGLFLYNRWNYDDPWMKGFLYQKDQLTKDVMSSHIYIKLALMWLIQFKIVMWIWIAKWWVRVLMVSLLLVPRVSVYAGAVLLSMHVLQVIVWLNGTTGQGTLWVVGTFMLVTMDHYMYYCHKDGGAGRVGTPWKKRCQSLITRLRPSS